MKLNFSFKDIFRAPRLAFRFQRIWINGLGLLSGYVVFLALTYLSLLVDGKSLSEIWDSYGILVCGYSQLDNWYSLIIFLVGVAAFFAIFLLTNTAVSRVVYMELRKEFFYSWTQAYRFAFRKWISNLGAMLTFVFMIAFFVVAGLIMGIIGRIPIIGELGNFLLTIPYMLAALLLLFIIIVTFFGIFLVPAVIATSDEDSLGGVFQSFSMTYNQPWRLISYSILTGLMEIAGIIILAFFLKKSYLLFEGLFAIGMGEKFARISEYGFFLMDKALPQLYSWMQYLFGSFSDQLYLGYHHTPLTLSVSQSISAYLFLIFMLFTGGAVLAYGEAIRNSGFTILYTDLYKIHEGENLLEREDEELRKEIEEKEDSEIKEKASRRKSKTRRKNDTDIEPENGT